MTALPARRRRRTMIGGVGALALAIAAGGLTALGASTVVNSKAGGAVAVDSRPVAVLPSTDNAALAVVNDDNELTSLVIATLTPTGIGGSIVTIPVNADASIGFGDTRRPLDREIDPVDPDSFFQALEGTLAVSLQFGEIVGADRLAALIEPVGPIQVNLPTDVIDSRDASADAVVEAGERELTPTLTVRSLRAIDDSGFTDDHHGIDVAIWSGLAAGAPSEIGQAPTTDEFARPVTSSTIDEVFARLWQGPVQVRDLLLQTTNPSPGVDVVLIDRRDSLLVFSQISPARVSTPNPGLVFRIEVPISSAQIVDEGGIFVSQTDLARTLVGELLYLSANVQSTDLTSSTDPAPARTRIEVADERFIADMKTLVPLIFGEADIVVAPNLVDGIDVVLRLGTGYIDLKKQQGATAPTTTDPPATTPDSAPDTSPTADVVDTRGDTVDTDG